eukprot:3417513-Rhodomonas_salina.2
MAVAMACAICLRVWPYARPTRSPVLTRRMVLPAHGRRYAHRGPYHCRSGPAAAKSSARQRNCRTVCTGKAIDFAGAAKPPGEITNLPGEIKCDPRTVCTGASGACI